MIRLAEEERSHRLHVNASNQACPTVAMAGNLCLSPSTSWSELFSPQIETKHKTTHNSLSPYPHLAAYFHHPTSHLQQNESRAANQTNLELKQIHRDNLQSSAKSR